ncbi:ABC transporter permease [Pelagibius sp. Alg239-R121]|uniref:ABC transporter permease n=1 Tax=Pelagibius sp. Alg239-R121 TaxID=2993448 RepID=UPI0024A7679A|nr:ABC transporter permease subunit [Pelagibius sp. Alg239-R121]
MKSRHDTLGTAALLLLILIAWEVAGQLRLVADGTLPALSAILTRLFAERSDYWPHILATLETSGLGFIIGNLIAVAAALVFCLWPIGERLLRGVNIAAFAVPPIAIVPVLVIALDGDVARITLAALLVYFPTMTATLAGLREVDPRSLDLVSAYGGGKLKALLLVRLRAAVPAIMSGFQVAAPAAVLGAILAEFGSGARWGLGTFLLGSLGRGEPDRLWGIGLAATAIAGVGYGLAALAAQWTTGRNRAVTIAPPPSESTSPQVERWRRSLLTLIAVLLPFLFWQMLLLAGDLSPIIAKTPLGVLDYLFFSNASPSAQSRLLQALSETIPITIGGMFIGLAVAFLLALLSFATPVVMRALLPFALVTQTMPLVALTPLAVLIFGRGITVTLVITISVTFFAAFVLLAQGFALIPRPAFDLVDAYGASTLQKLRLIAIPASRKWLFVAARLAMPKALLGVMIAEWLATGKGLGNLLNQSRGYLDYGMIWTVAVVSVLVAIALYQLTYTAERLTER